MDSPALLLGSTNAAIGLKDGMAVLQAGGSAIDAVVAAIKLIEENPDDHSVGFSGLPNLVGDVELDASIMDGQTLATGAVGALRDHQDAIQLAKYVMERLPHVLITGDGARRLARDANLPKRDLLTPESESIWRQRLTSIDRGARGSTYFERVRELVAEVARDPELPDAHGTVNVIARDIDGHLACGVSTSGWAWKYPGRLGDSPIIGAGNYADDRWGAAACTGRGEMAQRCCTAHSIVTFMRCGADLETAVSTAMADLTALDDPFASEVNVIAIDREGRHLGASTGEGRTYVMLRHDGAEVETVHRRVYPFKN